jgi:hypothetical protein
MHASINAGGHACIGWVNRVLVGLCRLPVKAVAFLEFLSASTEIVRLPAGFGLNDHQLRSGARTYAGTEFFGARIQRRGAG